MPPTGYLLNQRDRDQLAAMLARHKREVVQTRPSPASESGYSSEILLCLAPDGIPAYNGTSPGNANVRLYKLKQDAPPGGPWTFQGLINPDGSPFTTTVHNIHYVAHKPSTTNYIRVTMEKISGRLLCDAPVLAGTIFPCLFNEDFDRGSTVSAQIGTWVDDHWDYTLVTQPVFDSEGKQGPGKSYWKGWVTFAQSGRWELICIERSPSALWIEFKVRNDFGYEQLNFEVDVTRWWEGPDPGAKAIIQNVGPAVDGEYVFNGKRGARGRAQFDRYAMVYRVDWIECKHYSDSDSMASPVPGEQPPGDEQPVPPFVIEDGGNFDPGEFEFQPPVDDYIFF